MKTLAGRLSAAVLVAAVAGIVVTHAQGRGGGAWTTVGGDAQRTSSVRTDPKISVPKLQKPGFQFLWKRKLGTKDQALTQPVLLPNIIAYKGFKALAFVGGSADNVYSVDYDLNRMFWEQHLASASTTAGTAACPGGLTAITKATAAAVPVAGGRGGRGAARGAGGPGAAAAPAAPAATPVAPAPGQEGPIGPGPGGRGPVTPNAATPNAASANAASPNAPNAASRNPPVPTPNAATPNAPAAAARGAGAPAARGGFGRGAAGPQIAGGRGGGDNVFAISSGGMVHVMNPQIGTDQTPPVKFLPPNAKVVGSILVDNVLYAATTGNCGGAASGVWAVDLVADGNPVTTWDAQGAGIVGAAAPTFGTDSTVYVATGGGGSPTSNAVIALEPKTLKLKSWFSPGATAFTAAPVLFSHNGKDVVAVANKDGRIYLLDGAAIGGADHMTSLAKSAPLSTAAGEIGGLATWVDAAGTRWVAASVTGAVHADTKFPMANGAAAKGTIAAFTVVDQNGAPTLQPQWSSRDLAVPVTP
ncbi:MAG: hypothetical protein ABI818_02200, partial [Acidobacteriota bacterium]